MRWWRIGILVTVLITGVTILRGPAVLAQTAGDSSKPLLIQCDTPDKDGKKLCANDQNKVCTTDAECGEGGACVVAILDNPCTIADFLNQFIILAQWGVTLVVVLGTLMLIYGGFEWITAGGRPSKIDSGKRIFLGTLIGIMVTFSAYIIMNLTIGAITGTSTEALNPFAGPVSTVFGNTTEEQSFSGNGTPLDTVNNCHDRWDHCDNQIYCADVSDKSGAIHNLQATLNSKNCSCGAADGCYGSSTARCVQKFQIANNLPPTGQLDDATQQLVEGGGAPCGIPAAPEVIARVQSVGAQVPAPSITNAQSHSRSSKGCCVIKNGGTPLFCADQISQRTCLSLGAGNQYVDGECATAEKTQTVCGFCQFNSRCFGSATTAWCTTKVSPNISFQAGIMIGHPLCNSGYVNGLQTKAPW